MNVCPDCFTEMGLKRRIISVRPSAEVGMCDFLPTKKGVPAAAIAEIIGPIFRDVYGEIRTMEMYGMKSAEIRWRIFSTASLALRVIRSSKN